MKIVNLDTLKGYKPPCGYEILGIRQLDDGSYEVALEPLILSVWGSNR
jgi:hypothetical protein